MIDTLVPLFIGGLGPLEIGVILILLVLLFGADKIPKLARSAGDAKKEFDKARMEAKKEVEEYEQELEEGMKADEQPEPQPEPDVETTDTDTQKTSTEPTDG